MAKRAKSTPAPAADKAGRRLPVPPWAAAGGAYVLIAAALTWPLVIRMGSSVYGPYDHITTDLFSNINFYFWWIARAAATLTSPLFDPLIAAPFGSRLNLVNLTGFAAAPVTLLTNPVFSRNVIILANLVVSGIGMYALVKYLTGSTPAAFVAGIIFAFCPNMLVRSYTTYDSTQVQWLPLYTLYVLKFMEDRTWRSAVLAGVFLTCTILFAMPYYLVFLPVHTIVLMLAAAGWETWGANRGVGGVLRAAFSREALRAWLRAAAVVAVVFGVFLAYYVVVVGGPAYSETVQRTEQDLADLSLVPMDYLAPHPRGALFGDAAETSYWQVARQHKDPDSFVAYIGWTALALAAAGIGLGRSRYRWVFLSVVAVSLWATLGPSLLGIPTPSGLIHWLYAPFARRVLLYKVFVQLGMAALAGLGLVRILDRFRGGAARAGITAGAAVLLLAEYAIVPPALSVDLARTPPLYEAIRSLGPDTSLLEVPVRRNNGNMIQGYAYFQTVHGLPLVNPYFGLARVPERIRPFYRQMEVPIEAQEYANLAALRGLGISHLTYHWYLGTKTVIFHSLAAPGFGFLSRDFVFTPFTVDGLDRIFTSTANRDEDEFTGPYDYDFGNLYAITADPSPVALVFDYASPYEQRPGVLQADGITPFGWASALLDTTGTFYYPLADAEGDLIRLLRQGGKVTAVNLGDDPVRFTFSFTAAAPDTGRVIETRWEDRVVASCTIENGSASCTVSGLTLDGAATSELTILSRQPAFTTEIDMGYDRPVRLDTTAILSDFRVTAE